MQDSLSRNSSVGRATNMGAQVTPAPHSHAQEHMYTGMLCGDQVTPTWAMVGRQLHQARD